MLYNIPVDSHPTTTTTTMKLAKVVKHTGKRETGIDLQMRLIPLKTETEDKIPTVEVEVKKDPKKKSGGYWSVVCLQHDHNPKEDLQPERLDWS